MNECTTLEQLRGIDPKHEYSMDPETALITAVVDDMAIHDPFQSECGRFACTPDYYGIPLKAALVMTAHNMDCPKPFEEV